MISLSWIDFFKDSNYIIKRLIYNNMSILIPKYVIIIFTLIYLCLHHQIFDKLVPNSFRLVNFQDIIPRVPKIYCHVGREIIIDGKKFTGRQKNDCRIFLDDLSGVSIMQHLKSAYFTSLRDAAT